VLKVYRDGHKSSIREKHFSNQFSVFPNPVIDKIHVEFQQSKTGLTDIVLMDACGRIVKTFLKNTEVPGGMFNGQFDLNDVAPGLYSVVVQSDGVNSIQTIVITAR
jgi:hypothetical protein